MIGYLINGLIIFMILCYLLKPTVSFDKKKKIAFCFLTYGNINQKKLWLDFLRGYEPYYNIYIHPKDIEEVKADNFFSGHIITKTVPTEWGQPSLVQATLLLMYEMLQDPDNYKFVLICDQSIPIKSFDHVYQDLTRDNKSWFNYYLPTEDDEASYRHLKRKKTIPVKYQDSFLHQEQWMVLNRKHAQMLVDNFHILREFKDVRILDEMYFITLLNHWGVDLQNELTFPMCQNYWDFKRHDKLMFAQWFPSNGGANHPHTFYRIDKKTKKKLKESPCLFARKFSRSCIVNIFD